MSRLSRLKTATHGDDGKWAHAEILKLRARLAEKDQEIETHKAVLREARYALELAYKGKCRLNTVPDALDSIDYLMGEE